MSAPSPPRGGIEALPPAPVVILCRPQLGENIGTTARAMLNFGLIELRLVRPDCGWPNAKAVAAASGATEVAEPPRDLSHASRRRPATSIIFSPPRPGRASCESRS